MTEKEIFENDANLSENQLNAKINKEVYMKNDVINTVIKRCRGEKKSERKIDGFRKRLMTADTKISEYSEHEVKPKIENIFIMEKILEEYSVKIYEIDPYFYDYYRKKIQDD